MTHTETSIPFLPAHVKDSSNPDLQWSEKAIVHLCSRTFVHRDWENPQQLRFEEQEKFTKALKEIKEIIDKNLSDDDFQKKIEDIDKILQKVLIFQKLADPNLEVSEGHNGRRPYLHTLDVLRSLQTDRFDHLTAKMLRWAVLGHDLGKIAGANKKPSEYHGIISALLMSPFLYEQCPELGEETIQQILFIIQYHHTPEEFKRLFAYSDSEEFLENQEALFWLQNRFTPKVKQLLYELIRADISSVAVYNGYIKALDDLLVRV